MFVPMENRFVLEDKTVEILKGMTPEFGYGKLGEFVFYRTYSRIIWDRDEKGVIKKDANGDDIAIGQERWWQVIRRVIEGVMSIRKNHYVQQHIHWDDEYWQNYARDMAISAFNMHWMPPGRGLWAMGTDFVYERGSMALFNCSFVEVRDNIEKSAAWAMDVLMHGVGVGYRPFRNDDLFAGYPDADKHKVYVIPDTREGWCESIKKLIASYLKPSNGEKTFDYSKIREAGKPIRGFGGISSGPEPLRILHERIRKYFGNYIEWLKEKKGDRPYDSVRLKSDIMNAIGCCVVAGNVRRSALLSMAPVSDPTFLDLKNYDMYPEREDIGWISNNSVILETPEDFAKMSEISARVISNGEPGYFNAVNAKYGRLRVGKMDDVKEDTATGLNPCMTGDTLVLTADGRGGVPIKQLVDEGKDVKVFTELKDDSVGIRWMRNPRLTGEKVAVYKVTLDSGDVLRLTANHKLYISRTRCTRKVEDLKPGDSLRILNRYLPDNRSWSRADQYITHSIGGSTAIEHRLIAQDSYGFEDVETIHIHHLNGDKTDNRPENLKVEVEFDHLSSHSDGEGNPNFSGVSNSEIVSKGIELCKTLGRRFSTKEWHEYAPTVGMPISFSSFRENSLGDLLTFAKRCSVDAGVPEYSNLDPRTVRRFQESLQAGLDVHIVDGEIMVTKRCELTGEPFTVPFGKREQCFSLVSASNIYKAKNTEIVAKMRERCREIYEDRRECNKESQIEVFLDMKFSMGREPKKLEWMAECKKRGISCEICRDSSPFRKWSDLKNTAVESNHKVVSVTFDCYEDVYNGTVDETHQLFIGGFKDTTPYNRDKEVWIQTAQCGEILLPSESVCNIAETLPTRCSDIEQWFKACEYATFYCSSVNLLPTHSKETNKVLAKERRIGVGIVDITGWKHKNPINKITRWMRDGYTLIRKVNAQLAEEAGIPESIRTTTIKPGGSVPKVAGRTPGISYPTFRHTLVRVRVGKGSPVVSVLKGAGVPFEDDKYSPDTLVFEFPIVQGPSKPATEATIWEQAANVMLAQREWSDNSVSVTLYFQPKWLLHKVFRKEISIELLRYSFEQLNYPVTSDSDIQSIIGKVNSTGSYNNTLIKIVKKFDTYELHKYNPKNEEDQIEDVLATLAPVTKSLSLLPHTTEGVYEQSPQEGITLEEYERRVAQIKDLDWTNFIGSDGEDEKFCTGGVCSIIKKN